MTPSLLIVGAGPAGLAAASWARSLELETMLLEREAVPGGQLHLIHFELHNVPGAQGLTGARLAERLTGALEPALPCRHAAAVTVLDPTRAAVTLADGERLEARAILIATGQRRRTLAAAGAERLAGHGVSYSATRDRERFAGRVMVVVGGGDAAHENALILADAGCRVTLVARGAPRARPRFRERVAARAEITVLDHAEVTEVLGDASVTGVRVARAGDVRVVPCEGVVVKIGMIPNSEPFRDVLAVNESGHLRVDAAFRTRHPHVWAAGDVTGPAVLGIPVAWGQAVLAVESIRRALAAG